MPGTDFNGDGRDDILWRETNTGHLGNWLAAPNASFIDNSANSLVGVPTEWIVVATGDFNADGVDDLLWYHKGTGLIGNWLGQENGGWMINQQLLPLFTWTVAFAADFNGDGRDEILISGPSVGGGANIIDVVSAYGAMGILEYSMGPYGVVGSEWKIAGTGDFNGDGRDDILWRNDDGTVSNWSTTASYHNAYGLVGGVSDDWVISSEVHVTQDWQIAGTGDFNGDGCDDILWRHDSGAIGTWLGGGSGQFFINEPSVVAVSNDWLVAGIGDYNGDGTSDILWHNQQSGALTTSLGADAGILAAPIALGPVVSTNWQVQPSPDGVNIWDL